jgi:hypothetical protein
MLKGGYGLCDPVSLCFQLCDDFANVQGYALLFKHNILLKNWFQS